MKQILIFFHVFPYFSPFYTHPLSVLSFGKALWTTTASGHYGVVEQHGPSFAIDGFSSDSDIRFYHCRIDSPDWLQIDLQIERIIVAIRVTNRKDYYSSEDQFDLHMHDLEFRVGNIDVSGSQALILMVNQVISHKVL